MTVFEEDMTLKNQNQFGDLLLLHQTDPCFALGRCADSAVVQKNRLLIGGLMLKLDADKPAASVLWPETRAAPRES